MMKLISVFVIILELSIFQSEKRCRFTVMWFTKALRIGSIESVKRTCSIKRLLRDSDITERTDVLMSVCVCVCTASSVVPLHRWSVPRSAAAGHVKYIWQTSQNSAPVAALNSRQGDGLDRKGKNPKVCIQLRAADKRRRMRDVVFAEMFVSKYYRCAAVEGRATF